MNRGTRLLRVYVQHGSTGMFLDRMGAWVKSRDQAYGFRHSQAAIGFCSIRGLAGVQLVLSWEPQGPKLPIQPFADRLDYLAAVEHTKELLKKNTSLREGQLRVISEWDPTEPAPRKPRHA